LQTLVEHHELAGRWISSPHKGSGQLQGIRGPHRVKAQQSAGMGANIFTRQDFYPRFLQGVKEPAGSVFVVHTEHPLAPKSREGRPALDD